MWIIVILVVLAIVLFGASQIAIIFAIKEEFQDLNDKIDLLIQLHEGKKR